MLDYEFEHSAGVYRSLDNFNWDSLFMYSSFRVKSIFTFQCQLFDSEIYELQRLGLIAVVNAEKFNTKLDSPVSLFACQRFAHSISYYKPFLVLEL